MYHLIITGRPHWETEHLAQPALHLDVGLKLKAKQMH